MWNKMRRPGTETEHGVRRPASGGILLAVVGFGFLALLALSPEALAWKEPHHGRLTADLFQMSALAPHLDEMQADGRSNADHVSQAAMDPDAYIFYESCVGNVAFPFKDSEQVDIAGGGSCLYNLEHNNMAHSDEFSAEDNFELEYSRAVAAWNVQDRHKALHHLAHAFHFLEDSGMILHTECVTTGDRIYQCLTRHSDHEAQHRDWYLAKDTWYCNWRLNLCGGLHDPNWPGGFEYAFKNYPADLETDDGMSDRAEMLTLLVHADGWQAKLDGDLPDDYGCCRLSEGTDWYSNWDWDNAASSWNKDAVFTAHWELARVARGVLDKFARDVGLPAVALGNDQVELVYAYINAPVNKDTFSPPDPYAKFGIDHDDNGWSETRGITVKVDDASAQSETTIASNTRDDTGSGNWLPPVPKHRTTTLHIRTEIWDYDPADPDDWIATVEHRIPPMTFPAGTPTSPNSCQDSGVTRVCIRARSLGDRWDESAPSTSASFTGTLNPGGWYSTGGSLSLTATDGRSGVRVVYWRYAGEPSWRTYSVPIPVGTEGTTTFEFHAVDNYGNTEAQQSLAITIREPPVTSASVAGASGESGWYRGPLTVTLSCADALSGCLSTTYRIDGGAWKTYTAPIGVVAEGGHLLEYYSTDRAGNEEAVRSVPLPIDATRPPKATNTTACSGTTVNGWCRGSLNLAVSGTDATSGVKRMCLKPGGGILDCADGTSRSRTWESDTNTRVQFYAQDWAGNDGASENATVKVDRTAPDVWHTTSCSLWGENNWCRTAFTVALGVNDISGAAWIEYTTRAYCCYRTYTGPFTRSDGVFDLEYRAEDNAGLQSVPERYAAIMKSDTFAPAFNAPYGSCTMGSNGWCLGAASVSTSAYDSVSGLAYLRCKVDSGSWQNPCPATVTVSAEGIHIVSYEAKDNAGNVATTSALVKIDLYAPSVTIGKPEAGRLYVNDADAGYSLDPDRARVVGPITVQAFVYDSASGAAKVEFYVDDVLCATDATPWDGFSWYWDTECLDTRPDTPAVLKAVAYDRAGRSSQGNRGVWKAG